MCSTAVQEDVYKQTLVKGVNASSNTQQVLQAQSPERSPSETWDCCYSLLGKFPLPSFCLCTLSDSTENVKKHFLFWPFIVTETLVKPPAALLPAPPGCTA